MSILNPQPTGLVGKWILALDGEFEKNGQIVMEVGPEHYLIEMRPPKGGQPRAELWARDALCSDVPNDHLVSLFNSEAELDAWLTWELEETPRVVPMRKDLS
jgi:hypothetical protein